MNDALDGYYIRGVSHNISFLNALIAHERFKAGRLTTNFIAEEYPDGFHSHDVPQSDPLIPVTIIACLHRRHMRRGASISGQIRRFETHLSDDWVVIDADKHYALSVEELDGGFEVTHETQVYRVTTAWRFGETLVRANVNGVPVTLQVDREKAGYRLFHRGSERRLLVVTPASAALTAHMIEKIAPDMSQFLLSPMPGLLVRLSVAVGDEVKVGEELAVVEAMKMENSLRATDDVIVEKILVKEGDSLAVDQAIIEFVREVKAH
jgi:propionyl-CoA carboxylase alpha chain